MMNLSKTLYRYGRDPVSIALLVCVFVSAVVTFMSLAFLLGYILMQGIPNINLDLFAFEYNTQNVSLFPALVDTVIMVLLALAIATPLGIFAAIYLVEYASQGLRQIRFPVFRPSFTACSACCSL